MSVIPDHAHVLNCDKDDCPVCHSKLVEWREYWYQVWLEVVTSTDRDRQNHTITDYANQTDR